MTENQFCRIYSQWSGKDFSKLVDIEDQNLNGHQLYHVVTQCFNFRDIDGTIRDMVQYVTEYVCRQEMIDPLMLKSKSRRHIYTNARYLIWSILQDIYPSKLPLRALGEMFNRKHCTVIHGINTVADLRYSDKNYNIRYKQMRLHCKNQILTFQQ